MSCKYHENSNYKYDDEEIRALMMNRRERHVYYRLQLSIRNSHYIISELENRIYREKFMIEQLHLEMKYAPYERQRQMAMHYLRLGQVILFELQRDLGIEEMILEYDTEDLCRLISDVTYAQQFRINYEPSEIESAPELNNNSTSPITTFSKRKPSLKISSHFTSKMPRNNTDEKLALGIYDRYIAKQDQSTNFVDKDITSLPVYQRDVVLGKLDNIKDQTKENMKQTVYVHNESSDSDSEDSL